MLETDGFSFSNAAGRRRKRSTTTVTEIDVISTIIQRNGCWCPSVLLSGGERFHGVPLNSYDSACRKFSHCVHVAETCTSGACFNENLDAGFEWAIDVTDLSKGFACRSDNECDTAMCMCQVQFSKDVFELITADGANAMTFDYSHIGLNGTTAASVCVGRGTGNGVS